MFAGFIFSFATGWFSEEGLDIDSTRLLFAQRWGEKAYLPEK